MFNKGETVGPSDITAQAQSLTEGWVLNADGDFVRGHIERAPGLTPIEGLSAEQQLGLAADGLVLAARLLNNQSHILTV